MTRVVVRRQADHRRNADAGIDDQSPCRRAPKPPTSPPPSMTAPTPSCCRPKPRPANIPVEAVSTMDRIGEEVERDPTYRSVLTAQRPEPENTVGDAIADAARQIAETLDLSAIIPAGPRPARPRSAWRANGKAAGGGDHARSGPPGANCPSSGACIAWWPNTPTTRTTWSIAPARSRSATVLPRPASASSSWPACRSASPAPPTWSRIANVAPEGETKK